MKIHRIAATLAIMEGLSLFVLAGYLVVNTIFRATTELDAVIAMVIFALLAGIGLIISGNGIKKLRNFGRAPVILFNAITMGVSYYMITGDRIEIGALLATIALVTLVSALFAFPESK